MRSRERNARDGVSGALLHHGGNFLQYLEGPADGVRKVYERVRASSLHHHLEPLLDEPIQALQFNGWHMGFAEAPKSWMQAMVQARWERAVSALDTESEAASPGVGLLLQFWRQARGDSL